MTEQAADPIEAAQAALLVMDYQNAIFERLGGGEALLDGVKRAIALLRERGATIAYVRVAFADGEEPSATMGRRIGREAAGTLFHTDSPATQIHDDIAPQKDDIVVRKTRVGPFSTTDLHEQLQARGVDTLILAGISTSGVVLSAVRDAHDRDYRLLVLADLCADPEPDVHSFLIERIFPRQAEVISSDELRELIA